MNARENQGWLTIIYKVPSEPSTRRVIVWKKTRELGALLLQQSVYILPNSPQLKDALNQLKDQIQGFGGECRLLEVASLGLDQEKEIIEGFNRLRDQEYEELIEGCEALLREIERETKVEKFYFAELEEIEKDLQKLKEWFDAVVRRDFFGAALRERVSQLMKECEEKFDEFNQKVFSREEMVAREKETNIPGLQLRKRAKKVKQKERQTYTKSELIAKLKEVINKLENESLSVGEEQVGALPESVALEMGYQDRKGKKLLEIEMEWQ